MLTIYTAVGTLKFEKNVQGNPVPVIINNGREYGMAKEELMVWSCLAFQILTYPELEELYRHRYGTADDTPALPLSHYLNRLLLRGLLVKGDGISGADAIYRLLGTLTITPVENSFFLRLSTGLRLLWKGDIDKDGFFRLLKPTTCTPMEQTILALSKKVPLSTAELISCIDQDAKIDREADVMDTLYPSPDMTFETLADSVQLHHTQYPVLQAVSNLYLKQQILFQKM